MILVLILQGEKMPSLMLNLRMVERFDGQTGVKANVQELKQLLISLFVEFLQTSL